MTALTVIDSSFSFVLFVRPSSIRACSLLFLADSNDNSNPSRPYLGTDAFGNLIAEMPPRISLNSTATLTVNQWNHVALTYSFATNRISLYHNGLLKVTVPGPSPSYNPPVTSPPVYVTLASPLQGSNGAVIVAQPFMGMLDEFNIWSRALNASEIYTIAHPALWRQIDFVQKLDSIFRMK